MSEIFSLDSHFLYIYVQSISSHKGIADSEIETPFSILTLLRGKLHSKRFLTLLPGQLIVKDVQGIWQWNSATHHYHNFLYLMKREKFCFVMHTSFKIVNNLLHPEYTL